jgi:hypothetical protein
MNESWELKEEALARLLWKLVLEEDYGPVVTQTAE